MYEKVLKRIEEVKKSGLDDEEVSRVKKVLIGANLRSYNDVERIGNNFIRDFMSEINPFDYENLAERISKEDLEKRLCEHFAEENSVLSVIEPLEEK